MDPLDRSFAAVVCDWDGTVVADRRRSAARARRLVEQLCALGVEVVVVSGTHAENVDGQLRARPSGPGALYLCVNRGSEVYRVDDGGPRPVYRRRATADENARLDKAAAAAVAAFAANGLRTEVVSARLNRRKIDLIPEDAWRDPPKSAIAALLAATTERLRVHGYADLAAAVAVARDAAERAGLPEARITSDAKHVEIGLTDKADAMRWALGHLASRGIGPGLVLVAGDEFAPLGGVTGSDALLRVPGTERAVVLSVGVEPGGVPEGVVHRPGGPAVFLDVLAAWRERLRRGVPDVDEDPTWLLRLPASPGRDGVDSVLTSVSDGRFGTSGALDRVPVRCRVFTGTDAAQQLLEGPSWTCVETGGAPGERLLDLRTGVWAFRTTGTDRAVRVVRLSSVEHPGELALRAEADGPVRGPVLAMPDGVEGRTERAGPATWGRVAAVPVGGVAAAARERRGRFAGRSTVERRAAYVADQWRAPTASEALERLAERGDVPFAAMLAAHRAAWAGRWAGADVAIPDDPETQFAVRYAIFHLLSCAPSRGEAAVGARGLSGPGYRGHVFWDADVFVLPALAAIHPEGARAMLEYRLRRLDAARGFAAESGRRGARFPWESGRVGDDVTPHLGFVGADVVPIHTGEAEEHVVADVAWAAARYAAWSGDDAFLSGKGRPLLVETARYWASRVRVDDAGRAHLDRVVGPDEYHPLVDDNAFTNVMARWHLRRAAALTAPAEAEEWLRIADALVDGYDPQTRLYEQFSGYSALEPLTVADLGRAPLAADLLLGAARVAETQIVKQADVLMLHHLVPEEVEPGSLRPNLDRYGPRTSHGSSLSPAIHAAVLARAGEADAALEWLRLAARIDLDDRNGNSASGLHLGAMGGVWQALAYGFLGLRADGDTLRVDPHLPAAWSSCGMRLRFRRRRVEVVVTHDDVTVHADRPVNVAVRDAAPVTVVDRTVPLREVTG